MARNVTSTFIAAGILLVTFLSLYLMVGNFPPTTDFLHQEEINKIETKIKSIEGELSRNSETIDLIRKALLQDGNTSMNSDKLQALKNILNVEDKLVDSEHVAQTVMQVPMRHRNSTIHPEMCLFAQKPALKTDVNMEDVYDELRFDNPNGGVWKQGYNISYNKNQWDRRTLKIFVVPHSHTDPGWVKTFRTYYMSQTRLIFNQMLTKLEQYPKMRFVYAEMSFFSIWWSEIGADKKARVKKLVDEGRLEIVSGGWVMPDEANTHYFAIIDQLIEGHTWLNLNLNVKPVTSWAIDPFGHSSAMPYLLLQTGLKHMVIQRVHYAVKKELSRHKQLEFLWKQGWGDDDKRSPGILCHMMPFYSYDIPHTCGPNPGVCCQFDFKRLAPSKIRCPWGVRPVVISNENVALKAESLLDQYRMKAQLYKNDVLLVQLGDDFRYDTAEEWDDQYTNYQKLFDYINSRTDWHAEIKFATLSDYLNALRERSGTSGDAAPNYPTLSGDFFSYADRDDHYWTGYFTSRPFFKHMSRVVEAELRRAEILFSFAHWKASQSVETLYGKLVTSRQSLGLFQHHDGITGTGRDFVVNDYSTKLYTALVDSRNVQLTAAQALLGIPTATMVFEVDEKRAAHDSIADHTVISITNGHSVDIVLQNSLGWARSELVTFHISSPFVSVQSPNGTLVKAQVSPYWVDKEQLANNRFRLSFVADLPPLALAKYTIIAKEASLNKLTYFAQTTLLHSRSSESTNRGGFVINRLSTSSSTLETSFIRLDLEDGLLRRITNKLDGCSLDLKTMFVKYGTRSGKERSGAYLFLPDGPAVPLAISNPLVRVTIGPLMSESRAFINRVEHNVRIINSGGVDSQSVLINNIIDIRRETNFEFAMRFETKIANTDRYFYTDLNGFQIQRRKIYDKLPMQANFYPVPAMAFIEDNNQRLNLLTNQPVGFSSLHVGWMEAIMDRKLNQDDQRGLGQPMIDNRRTEISFRLLLEKRVVEKSETSLAFPSLLGHHSSLAHLHPVASFLQTKPARTSANQISSVPEGLPCEVHLVNLRTIQKSTQFTPSTDKALILHRLGFDCSFPSRGLQCVTSNGVINVQKLFGASSVTRTSLSLMYDKGEISSPVKLEPMELATFRLAKDD